MKYRTVVIEGKENPFSDIVKGDKFQIKEPDGTLSEEIYVASGYPYKNDNGVLTVNIEAPDVK